MVDVTVPIRTMGLPSDLTGGTEERSRLMDTGAGQRMAIAARGY